MAAAKRQIEADREEVKERADRERVARAAREKAAADLAARKAELDSTGAAVQTETADMLVDSTAEEQDADEDEDDEDDVDPRGDFRPKFSHPDGDDDDGPEIQYGTRHRGHRWGDGNKLGKQ